MISAQCDSFFLNSYTDQTLPIVQVAFLEDNSAFVSHSRK